MAEATASAPTNDLATSRRLATQHRQNVKSVDIFESGKFPTRNLSLHVIRYMLCLPSKLFAALVFVARIPFVAAMEAGDDFSNNLFSDLAPLLTLFGEQVPTKCSLVS